MTRRKYNADLVNWLRENAKDYTIKELMPIVNKKFNETHTRLSLQKLLVRNKIEYKYKNKNNSHNISKLELLTEYTKPDGMTLVKIGRNRWEYKQRLIYELYYGVELTSDDYIIFLDQDRTNFDINNLARINRRESSILSNQKIFSKDKETTKTAIQVAKLMIKTNEVERKLNNDLGRIK